MLEVKKQEDIDYTHFIREWTFNHPKTKIPGFTEWNRYYRVHYK